MYNLACDLVRHHRTEPGAVKRPKNCISCSIRRAANSGRFPIAAAIGKGAPATIGTLTKGHSQLPPLRAARAAPGWGTGPACADAGSPFTHRLRRMAKSGPAVAVAQGGPETSPWPEPGISVTIPRRNFLVRSVLLW